MNNKRVFLIVLDSFGIGNAPDADKFGDKDANTLKSLYDSGILETPHLSKMGLYNGGTGNLYIGSVIHKTHIEMGEKGTKAGAVTAVIMCGNAAMPEEVKEVILDRPFVYAIVDDATNIPIFIGAVNSIK